LTPKIVNMSLQIPQPQLIDPTSVPSLRWGIYGTGWISEEFASSCTTHTGQQIISVASRTEGKAKEFAEKMNITEFDESYETLAAREDIDAVYIATRPSGHLEHALIAINAGKHVLVEKPFALNPDEARQIFEAAKAAGVFAMEAMWNRYLPQASVVRQIKEQGLLGEPRLMLVDFCQDHTDMPARWVKGGGSAMYDMGVYPVAFSIEHMGYPSSIRALGQLSESGVEAEVTAILDYENGARAIFTLSALNHAPHHATISGTEGIIEYLTPFVVPSGISLSQAGFNTERTTWVDDLPQRGHQGLGYEATAFASYVGAGLTESPLHPHEETVKALEIIAEILRQVGA
jgi:predicted dehydrogenase